MSDSELRLLERRWRETGAAEDEARWLAERVRAGELEGAWLEALAFFGHEPAQLAGGKAPDPWDLDDSNVWGAKLRPLGVPVVVRATLAAAWLGVEPWERAHPGDLGRGPRPMLEAVEAWLACPCERHATTAKEAGEARDDDPIEVDDDDNEVELPVRWALSTAGRLGRALPAGTVAAATQALHSVARDLKREVPRPAILAAIRDALVPLVCGQAGAPTSAQAALPTSGAAPTHAPPTPAVVGPLRVDPAVERFVAATRTYCALVEGGAMRAAQAGPIAAALAELLAATFALPDPGPGDDDSGSAADREGALPTLDVDFGERDHYREVFDPYGEEAPVGGSLSDDLRDVHADLKRGLCLFDLGTPAGTREAVFEWRLAFDAHWGEHATSALRALYWLASGRASAG